MIKRLTLAAILAFVASPAAAQAPTLHPTILVSSALVRIGDLVDRVAPEKAQIAVFRAPDLGDTGTVTAARIIDALRSHDVFAVNSAGASEVSVTRASRVVGTAEIRSRIAELLAERLRVSDAANVALSFDLPLGAIHLDPSETGKLEPLRINLDRSGRFDVTFKGAAAAQLRFAGSANEAYDLVVATRTLARGDVLRDSDVTIEKRAKSEIQGEPLRDPATVIGMALQTPMRPGQAVRTSDIVRPQVVKRGEPVVLHYHVPGIALTMRGRAEENGAVGDTVNIVNIQSKRIIQGIVTGPGQVTVTSMTPRVTPPAGHQQLSSLTAGRNKSE